VIAKSQVKNRQGSDEINYAGFDRNVRGYGVKLAVIAFSDAARKCSLFIPFFGSKGGNCSRKMKCTYFALITVMQVQGLVHFNY